MTLAKATGSKHPDPSVVPRNSGTMAEQTVPASDPCNSGPLYFPSTLPIEGGNNTEDDDDRQRSSTANPLPGNTSDEEGAIDENPPSKAEDSVMNDAETSAWEFFFLSFLSILLLAQFVHAYLLLSTGLAGHSPL
jgi:hypothetical protein